MEYISRRAGGAVEKAVMLSSLMGWKHRIQGLASEHTMEVTSGSESFDTSAVVVSERSRAGVQACVDRLSPGCKLLSFNDIQGKSYPSLTFAAVDSCDAGRLTEAQCLVMLSRGEKFSYHVCEGAGSRDRLVAMQRLAKCKLRRNAVCDVQSRGVPLEYKGTVTDCFCSECSMSQVLAGMTHLGQVGSLSMEQREQSDAWVPVLSRSPQTYDIILEEAESGIPVEWLEVIRPDLRAMVLAKVGRFPSLAELMAVYSACGIPAALTAGLSVRERDDVLTVVKTEDSFSFGFWNFVVGAYGTHGWEWFSHNQFADVAGGPLEAEEPTGCADVGGEDVQSDSVVTQVQDFPEGYCYLNLFAAPHRGFVAQQLGANPIYADIIKMPGLVSFRDAATWVVSKWQDKSHIGPERAALVVAPTVPVGGESAQRVVYRPAARQLEWARGCRADLIVVRHKQDRELVQELFDSGELAAVPVVTLSAVDGLLVYAKVLFCDFGGDISEADVAALLGISTSLVWAEFEEVPSVACDTVNSRLALLNALERGGHPYKLARGGVQAARGARLRFLQAVKGTEDMHHLSVPVHVGDVLEVRRLFFTCQEGKGVETWVVPGQRNLIRFVFQSGQSVVECSLDDWWIANLKVVPGLKCETMRKGRLLADEFGEGVLSRDRMVRIAMGDSQVFVFRSSGEMFVCEGLFVYKPVTLDVAKKKRIFRVRSDDCCSICLEPGGQQVMVHCGHVFDNKCLTKWLVGSHGCPVCRQEVS